MKKRFLALALGTLAFGVTLGGVKMGLGHQDAMMVKAAEVETVVVEFDAKNDKGTSATKLSKEGVTLSVGQGALNNGTDYRIYKNQTLTISQTKNLKIIQVKFTCTNSGTSKGSPDHFKVPTSGTGSYTSQGTVGTWTGSADSVVLKADTDQVRATNISVTLEKDTPVVTSPVTSISAELTDPKATFFVGDKATLDAFTITATHKDGNTSVLKSDVTIESPILVEGDNVIKFQYVSGETPLECQFVVKAIKGNFYTKSTATADIVAGKKIYIANTNGDVTKILDKQNDNNRAEIKVETSGDRIVAQDTYTSLLVLPAKNGTFALYDEKEMGVLYAAGSGKGNNYLRTEKVFEDINANSFAKLSCANEVWTIEFTGSNTNNSLRHNNSSPLFSCYASGQIAPSIYVSPDAPVTFGTETWAETFLAKLNEICDPTGNTALTEAKWSEAKATFDALSIPDKMAIKYGNFEGEKMKQALAGYNFIINTKYTALYDFLGRRTTTKANVLMLPGATDSTTWTLVGIGAVTIAASASLLFFRRKKSN